MKQGVLSSSAESKSGPATAAASIPAAQHRKCRNCSGQFETSRARCSHQSTHPMAREMRLKPYGAVLGAVLIHHIPSNDEDEVNGPPLSSEPEAAHGSSQNPVQEAQIKNAKGKEPAVTAAGFSQPPAPIKEVPVLEKFDQLPKQQQQPVPEPQQMTKDLLGEWSPTCIIRGEAEGTGSSWELTLDLAEARVSAEMDDNLDLELKLCSMNNKTVDLELKLGFLF